MAILYSPTERDGALKSPCSFVDTLRIRPVLVWVMVTEQFGKTPPVESKTVPRRFPVATWAEQMQAIRVESSAISRSFFIYWTNRCSDYISIQSRDSHGADLQLVNLSAPLRYHLIGLNMTDNAFDLIDQALGAGG